MIKPDKIDLMGISLQLGTLRTNLLKVYTAGGAGRTILYPHKLQEEGVDMR